ncbi:uncharacterized protein BCN122_II2903 [Burkholderia cenocepacia]|nr:uncharacterized protein BCN122_II2903 [Burkholderia cenocepacia]
MCQSLVDAASDLLEDMQCCLEVGYVDFCHQILPHMIECGFDRSNHCTAGLCQNNVIFPPILFIGLS